MTNNLLDSPLRHDRPGVKTRRGGTTEELTSLKFGEATAPTDDFLTNEAHPTLTYSRFTHHEASGSDTSTRPLIESSPNKVLAEQHLGNGRFVIEGELGTGGEGVVYQAHDTERDQKVAIKRLHTGEYASLGALKREFRFVRGLIHPNLVQLHELFIDHDESFFTMALVTGQTFLEAAGRTHPLRPLFTQLLEVVRFLHTEGRIHRDLKPSNILIRPDGRLILVDFGAALDLRAEKRRLHEIVGTPHYMAPEVVRGAPPSARSDAYSIGVILYEALTGTSPSPSSSMSGLGPRPSQVTSPLPTDLDELCSLLLTPDPSRRFTAEDALRYLNRNPTDQPPQRDTLVPERRGFAGRARELLHLETAFVRMLEEQEPVVVFVSGASGMGKSALLHRFESIRKDALVLASTCFDSEFVRHKAFDGVISGLVSHLIQNQQTPQIVASLSGAEIAALTQLFPELREVEEILERTPNGKLGLEPRAVRTLGYRAVAKLLSTVGERTPLIVMLDDLQWGDIDSARLLNEVFSGVFAPACLLVLAYRSDMAQTPCLIELRHGSECLEDTIPFLDFQLEPLSKDESVQLVERIRSTTAPPGTLTADELERIVSLAQGSPLILSELVVASSTTNASARTPDMEDIIRIRLTELRPRAQELFSYLCLAGHLPTDRLDRLMGTASPELVDQLILSRLAEFRRGNTELWPIHDAIRRSALGAINIALRPAHKRIAELWLLEPVNAERAAQHFHLAGARAEAAVYAERAADEARSRLSLQQAVELLKLALESTSEADVNRQTHLRVKLAEALADAGCGADAAPLFAELAGTAPPELALTYRRRAAEQWLSSGSINEGLELLARVHQEVGLSWKRSVKGALLSLPWRRLISTIYHKRTPITNVALSDHARLRLDTCRAAWSVAHVSNVHGAANSARYLALALKTREPENMALAFGMEAIFRAMAGSPARRLVEDYRGRAELYVPEPRTAYHEGFLAFVHALTRYLMGDIYESDQEFERAEGILEGRCRAVAWELAAARIFWSSTLLFLGKHRELERRLSDWLRDARLRRDLYALTGLELSRARRLALRDGDTDEALALIEVVTSNWTSPYLGVHEAYARIVTCHTELVGGRPDRALAQMDEFRRRMGISMISRVQLVRVQERVCRGIALLMMAIEGARSHRMQRLQQVKTVAAALAKEDVPWAQAAAIQLRSSALWMERRSGAAVSGLREAAQKYRALGFNVHAASVDLVWAELTGGDEGRDTRRRALSVFMAADIDTLGGPARAYAPPVHDS